ncbi:hypothetical protein NQ315_005216 [Exocentrus adspersus]|uniref:Uncharacterized protein n=1 Tax=Exocentrus adspersus TaxID=1586481 RepID=A0AAV8VV53_9CUCU|nr:hypothetical protein NQ315_005216 [Exocentrus adspersus]
MLSRKLEEKDALLETTKSELGKNQIRNAGKYSGSVVGVLYGLGKRWISKRAEEKTVIAIVVENLIQMPLGRPDKKQPAPRMYCDICEESLIFTRLKIAPQGDDELHLLIQNPWEEPGQKPPPRFYCTFGTFGHATENYTEDQEF